MSEFGSYVRELSPQLFQLFTSAFKNCINHLNSSKFTNKTTRGFNIRDPINTLRVHQHPQVLEIFTRHSWMGYLEELRGYDDEVAQDFSLSLIPLTRVHATVVVRGLSIELTPELISRITTLSLGVP